MRWESTNGTDPERVRERLRFEHSASFVASHGQDLTPYQRDLAAARAWAFSFALDCLCGFESLEDPF